MRLIALLGLFIISSWAKAQDPEPNQENDNTDNQFVPKEITIKLSPIICERGKYFYDGRRVKFEDIVLPMISINDAVVDSRLRTVRTLTDVRKGLIYAEFGYLLFIHTSTTSNSSNAYSDVIVALVAMIVFNELFNISILVAKKKTIERYNDVVLQPSFSLGRTGGASFGLTFRF